MVRVVIVEDRIFEREGIKSIISQDKEIDVVGCAGNGYEALELCDALSPDIVLMDIMMPECNGIDGTKMIKVRYPLIKVLIFSYIFDEDSVIRAMESGADGYILKEMPPQDLINTIKNTVNGLNVYDSTIFKIYNKLRNKKSDIDVELSAIEKEIVKLIVYGKNNKQISEILHLSEGRVRNLITVIFRKFNVDDRIKLAVLVVSKNYDFD